MNIEDNIDDSNTREQIELDRISLISKISQQNGFSYIPYLFKRSKAMEKQRLNMRSLSTIELLKKIENIFNSSNIKAIKRLSIFKNELVSRNDLFESAMQFLHKRNVEDDLFYWTPGCKIDNIFSLIAEIIRDFPEKYKIYYIKNIVLKSAEYYDCLNYIKERHKSEYEQFKMIQKDMGMFDNCVTSIYWIDENAERYDDVLGLPSRIDICDDLEGVLVPEISYIEILIGPKSLLTTVYHLNNLIRKCHRSKGYWKALGIIDDDYNIMI